MHAEPVGKRRGYVAIGAQYFLQELNTLQLTESICICVCVTYTAMHQTQGQIDFAVLARVEGRVDRLREVVALGRAIEQNGIVRWGDALQSKALSILQLLARAILVIAADNAKRVAHAGPLRRCHSELAVLVDGLTEAYGVLIDDHRQSGLQLGRVHVLYVHIDGHQLNGRPDGYVVLGRRQLHLLLKVVEERARLLHQQLATIPHLPKADHFVLKSNSFAII